ncbi:pantoate kinase [Halocatena pleomorpha]|uniref:Pantoate kinase n=1 Tax=Halocatena pleomorpha TaxID=1785090 RepID=A0A3P3R4I6_9EURY|nr:pantoate kinase [Halocatena pleomorpha]RRJ28407.1 sugar kinase [Halocatena pleomorpha]
MSRSPSAFVPGHITGFFSTHPHKNPEKAGSRGAGLALSDGVSVSIERAAESAVVLNDEQVSMAAVEGVLDRLGVTARVTIRTELPVSAGFGVSGASALGTALTANTITEDDRTENELIALAHAAEVEAGTGLGDVVGQARGGVPIRREPGGPPHGQIDGLFVRDRIEYVSFGGLDTAAILGGDTAALSRAGEDALTGLLEQPTLEQFMAESRRFAREAGLLTERVEETIAAVQNVGGEASMAMLGETVFALGEGLTKAGYDPTVCHIDGGPRNECRQRTTFLDAR